MKTSFAVILMITVGILGFIIGYSMAPTDVADVRHSVSQKAAPASGGETSSGNNTKELNSCREWEDKLPIFGLNKPKQAKAS